MSTSPTDLHGYRILAGVDGSEGSAAAVRYAASEALRTGTGLRLMHVVPEYTAMSPMLPLAPSELAETGRSVLEKAATEAARILEPGRVMSTLETGPRVACLVRASEHAARVVLGREARSSLERVVTGATTIGVAARATCPTIAVPPRWAPGSGRSRILVGLKSTIHSKALLRRAFGTAAQRNAELVLVHAWELPSGYDDMIVRRAAEQEWSDHARQQIEPYLSEWRSAFPDVPVELRIEHGQPARVLRDASREGDLLMLVRRLHAFPGGHLGGTGRALLRESACPVEVVPLGVGAAPDTDLVLEQDGLLLK